MPDPTPTLSISAEQIQALTHLIQTVHRLRAPGGCPWDMKQTHQSLRQYVIEEAYEVLEVLDQLDSSEKLKSDAKLAATFQEELGDLLLQVVLHSEMASETGALDIFSVAGGLAEKLIRRHPHVFGEVQVDGADKVLENWEKQKAAEKSAKSAEASILDGLPKSLPALQRTSRLIDKVTRVGFQWNDLSGPLEKLDEELSEFQHEVRALEVAKKSATEVSSLQKKAQQELGDLLFSLCNIAFLLKLDPEVALRGTLQRFESRFRHVE
ncbi:MAG: nucleoside triphosphate pyrophosphohydrolase, partial [Bdellovibrionales bacterium]|nr:nucleoside triphosphate pyrophosphohydrolase [Bdellovibrionales bacterium]